MLTFIVLHFSANEYMELNFTVIYVIFILKSIRVYTVRLSIICNILFNWNNQDNIYSYKVFISLYTNIYEKCLIYDIFKYLFIISIQLFVLQLLVLSLKFQVFELKYFLWMVVYIIMAHILYSYDLAIFQVFYLYCGLRYVS